MEITFEHGDKSYTLYLREGDREWPFMLQNETGEGMSMSSKNLYDLFDEHFKKEF